MKNYTTPTRKPMMYGGDSRMKRMSGSPPAGERKPDRVNPKGATTLAKMQNATPAEIQAQIREDLERMSTEDLMRLSNESSQEGNIARSILRERGVEGSMPPGDQEPAGKMYGGKAKKSSY